MAEIQHPAFANVTETVPDDRLSEWLEAGWLERPSEIESQRPAVRQPEEVNQDPSPCTAR